MPTVSIIITTHNRVESLKAAINSARNAGGETEIIVVDDASSDGTQDYCKSLADVKYIRLNKNLKTAAARNAGLRLAQARYIVFLDDDDLMLPNSLEKRVEILESDAGCGLVFGKYLSMDTDGKIIDTPPLPIACPEGDIFKEMLRCNFLAVATVVTRRHVFADVGNFDESEGMYGIEDWDMWLRICEKYPVRSVMEPVGAYRIPSLGTGQWSSDVTQQFERVAKAYDAKWLELKRSRQLLSENAVKRGDLLNSVADRILYDIGANTKGGFEKLKKTAVAIRCNPKKLAQIRFYKSLARAFFVG